MMAGSTAGLLISLNATKNAAISDGRASLINFGGFWGTWFALCAAAIADVQGDETQYGFIAAGGDIGVLTTAIAAKNTQMNRGRARLINIAGVVGTVFGLGVAVLAEVDDGQAAFCFDEFLKM